MNQLISTYRLQFHKEFSFAQLEQVIPYLSKLGVGTVYASPIFESIPGSKHGYDQINPLRINPEIGTREALEKISSLLHKSGISWLQDIVPNHMAFHHKNEWLMDVLENGQRSRYASYFDITWTSPFHYGRLMVPFLNEAVEEAIQNGALQVAFKEGRLVFSYGEVAWPLQPQSYVTILEAVDVLPPAGIRELIVAIQQLENEEAYEKKWEQLKRQLDVLQKAEPFTNYISKCLEKLNCAPEALQKIAAHQYYHLCHWKETEDQINYRRFFTVNSLICMKIEDPVVFEHYHQLVASLLQQDVIQGLRIDHIDGLYHPTQYLDRLRSLAGSDIPVYVEKILEPGESIPKNWPIQGNTGYDFLSLVNNLFTNQNSEQIFTNIYKHFEKDRRSIHALIQEKKSYILYHHMRGELELLFQLLVTSGIVEKEKLDSFNSKDLKAVIGAFLIECPVYRFYGNRFPLEHDEAVEVSQLLQIIRKKNEGLNDAVDLLEWIFLKKPAEQNDEFNKKTAHFYQRCMQFTGPLMAKGVEDTLMYTFHKFIGHNEVGDAPFSFGISTEAFHAAMVERQLHWPQTLNATSTHDTKRGEDVRARLNVVTDLSEEWYDAVQQWHAGNADSKKKNVPDDNDEYFIYQTLVGSAPVEGIDTDDFSARIKEYLQKAWREGKKNSSWEQPNETYETNVIHFIDVLLDPSHTFRKSFETFQESIVDHGMLNALSQVILKFTCPGIPDVYQGCELWDFSLVDPDNRRPIDYYRRAQLLEEIFIQVDVKKLWKERSSGQIKLWLIHLLSNLRSQMPDLFISGEYVPLKVTGVYATYVCAYARKFRQQMIVVVIPLHTALICREQKVTLEKMNWGDTAVHFPERIAPGWINLVGEDVHTIKNSIGVDQLFRQMPLAVLKGKRLFNERGAGVLLHLSSLPSPYGIGDMGQEAYNFAEFLLHSRQKYWQLLPLHPTEAGQGHSPYSATSSRAGNILFISPEKLVQDGLLDTTEIEKVFVLQDGQTNFPEAEKNKNRLFDIAWHAFVAGKGGHLKKDFDAFQVREKKWLNDFSLYSLLKQHNLGKPWFEWNEESKQRDKQTLKRLEQANGETLEKIKWLQFLFDRQWKALKHYCNERGISLIGDIPFYVSYDSADVWAHRQYFAIDAAGQCTGMAGVPPDAFSDDGQLWGMPVFRWDMLKENHYQWWIDRLRKNIELFDVVRLDHFRAFVDYWEVPAGALTAKNGLWKPGPGAPFFHALRKALGELPFVAEDLGDIDEPVYQLRDQFQLPGMKVLQFAFGGSVSTSLHIPHNYDKNFIVYTGTHDNNTTRGWFTRDAGEQARLELELYVGRPVSAAEVSMVLARLAYASVASIVILPMQDVLNLDESARMNRPSSVVGNWSWRLVPGQLNEISAENLKRWTSLFNRE